MNTPLTQSNLSFYNRMNDTVVSTILDHIDPNTDTDIDIIKTGIPGFDDAFGGLIRGRTYMVGPRPAMGGTALALNIACNLAFSGQKVLYFTLQETLTMTLKKILNIRTGFPINKTETNQQRECLSQTITNLKTASLIIDDSPEITIAEIYGKCVREEKTDLIVIDRFMTELASRPNDIAVTLQRLGIKCNCPILMIYRTKSDLKEVPGQPFFTFDEESVSKSIDNTEFPIYGFDYIFLLFRPYYYTINRNEKETLLSAIRTPDGIRSSCYIKYNAESMRYS